MFHKPFRALEWYAQAAARFLGARRKVAGYSGPDAAFDERSGFNTGGSWWHLNYQGQTPEFQIDYQMAFGRVNPSPGCSVTSIDDRKSVAG